MQLEEIVPILRSFDEVKAKGFYIDFLGFKLDWEHRFDDAAPLYMQISKEKVILHVSEHYGDASPGASMRIKVSDIDAYQNELLNKQFKYSRPGIESMPWGTRDMEIPDPFGNKLIFTDDGA